MFTKTYLYIVSKPLEAVKLIYQKILIEITNSTNLAEHSNIFLIILKYKEN